MKSKILKESNHYKAFKNKDYVQCNLCPHYCIIKKNETGFCGVRFNIDNKLYSLYNVASALNIDPIEKKPLYHFLPGTKILSIGGFGCNFNCLNCQNYDISQINFKLKQIDILDQFKVNSESIINQAKINKINSIAYTYNEPTVFYEFMLDTAKSAKKNNLKNVVVSNGFINKEPLKELIDYIDAFNIDLKFFDEKNYKKITSGRLSSVLKTIKFIAENNTHLEVTHLYIPNYSNLNVIEKISKYLSKWNIPLHISAYFPVYKLKQRSTTYDELIKAKKIASKYLDYVYLGNINKESNTYCKKCGRLLIKRFNYNIYIDEYFKKHKKCECGYKPNIIMN